jgi:hypothetical protein
MPYLPGKSGSWEPRKLPESQNRAVMFGKITEAAEALKLPPGSPIGMTIGPQVVQPQPATIVTIGVGTKVHRGVHGTRTSVRWRHGIGRHRTRWCEMRGTSFTQGTMGLFRQALKRFGQQF